MKLLPRQKPFRTQTPDEEAAQWLARINGRPPRASENARLERWLAADPANRAAIERAETACDVAGTHAAAPEILAMRHAALAARCERSRLPWALAAGVMAIGLGVATTWMAMRGTLGPADSNTDFPRSGALTSALRPTLYTTAVGEHARISLPDGSIATLDTQSSLEVIYSETERGVKLLRGQALFEVAKHRATPFQVYASGRRITALGTTFNVSLDGARLRVALIEGRVRVAATPAASPVSAPLQQITMEPGDILEADGAAPMTVTMADGRRTVSWRDDVAVFVDTRLGDAVAEMNRYTSTPIVIGDPSIGEYRVSGVFRTGDPEQFAESLAKVFPLSLDRTSGGSVVLHVRKKTESIFVNP